MMISLTLFICTILAFWFLFLFYISIATPYPFTYISALSSPPLLVCGEHILTVACTARRDDIQSVNSVDNRNNIFLISLNRF